MRPILLVLALIGTTTLWAAQTCPSQLERVAPNARYIDNADGTISDKATGLMWKKCSEGLSGTACDSGTAISNYWEPALQAASTNTFAGYSDWRLPNLPELRTLIETGCHNPAINTGLFPETVEGSFYLSSTVDHLTGLVHVILFRDGSGGLYSREFFAVTRLVRQIGTQNRGKDDAY